jgi:tetratricopeptide (TPR) repeat protein
MFSLSFRNKSSSRLSRKFTVLLTCSILSLPVLAFCHPLFAQTAAQQVSTLERQAASDIHAGNADSAAVALQKAISLAPHNPAPQVEYGNLLVVEEKYPDAIAAFQSALKYSPHNLDADLGLATCYRKLRNFDEAKRTLQRAIAEHPKSPQPLALLGDIEIELQTYDIAIQHLTAALALDPSNTETRNWLAASYKAKGDSANALRELDKVLARDPNNSLAHFLRGEIYADNNEDNKALVEAKRVVQLEPQNPRGLVLLAKILVRIPPGGTPAQTVERCKQAVDALEPVQHSPAVDSETLFLLARAYRCAGEEDQAKKTLAQFETSSQNDRTTRQNQTQALHLVEQADDLAIKNDYQGALSLLQQAIQIDPTYAASYSQLAKLYYSAGEIDKASDAISQALSRNPNEPDFLYVQGKILEGGGKFDDALASFTKSTLINPNESDSFYEMGLIYQHQQDRVRAASAFKKALAISPDDPDYRRALAALSSGSSTPPPQ